jgi:hypothetical protein
LDVEDAEIQALEGAHGVLSSREALVLYEDHGQDSSCHTSEYFLKNLNFDIFYCDEQKKLTRVNSVDDVRNIKKHTSSGYNFHACSRGSAFSGMLANHSR